MKQNCFEANVNKSIEMNIEHVRFKSLFKT